jgi:hypothetical protein
MTGGQAAQTWSRRQIEAFQYFKPVALSIPQGILKSEPAQVEDDVQWFAGTSTLF